MTNQFASMTTFDNRVGKKPKNALKMKDQVFAGWRVTGEGYSFGGNRHLPIECVTCGATANKPLQARNRWKAHECPTNQSPPDHPAGSSGSPTTNPGELPRGVK